MRKTKKQYYVGQYPINIFHNNLVLILQEIDRVCKENNICYVLMYGTALGAMRHSNFIPWDDDADIGMDRKNYKKFIKAVKQNKLKINFSVDAPEVNKNWGASYAKVRLVDTYFPEKWSENISKSNGLWVDIFIFDKCPRFVSKINRKCSCFFQKVILYKSKAQLSYNGIVLLKIFSILPYCLLHFFRTLFNRMYNIFPSKYVRCMTFTLYDLNYRYKKESFIITKSVSFRGLYFPVSFNCEEMLEQYYGDWKKLPPVSERNPKHIKIDKIKLLDI